MKNLFRGTKLCISALELQLRASRACRISWPGSLMLLLRHGRLKLISCRKAKIRVHRKSVRGEGMLIFGATWPKSYSVPSQLVVHRTGELHLERRSKICHGATISVAEKARLELKGCFINNNANIACYHEVSIGEGTVISENVTIRDNDGHTIIGRKNHGRIAIGNNVWIGLNVIILKDVVIGEGAIVAAGSTVTQDVAASTLVGGNPARLIRERVSWS